MSVSFTERIGGEFLDHGGTVFNVRHPDFGARGDGSGDDAPAFNRAIAAAAERGGGIVFAPAGTYATRAPVLFRPEVSLRGVSPEASVILAAHEDPVVAPQAPGERARGTEIGSLHLSRDRAFEGRGVGLRLSNHRSGLFSRLRITACETGLLFRPDSDGSFSYFNTFVDLEIFGCAEHAVVLDAAGTDHPNANYFVRGDWRGGRVTLLLREGGGVVFDAISIQGADVDWAQIHGVHCRLINPRLENPSDRRLGPGHGLVFLAPGGQVIGGTSSKGHIVPYSRDREDHDTTVLGHRASGRTLTLIPAALDDLGWGTRDFGAPWGGFGRHENLLRESGRPDLQPPWTVQGDVDVILRQPDPAGDRSGARIVFGQRGESSYGQVVPLSDAASALCWSAWMRAEDSGVVGLRLGLVREGRTVDADTTWVHVTPWWRRVHLSRPPRAADEGRAVAEVFSRPEQGNLSRVEVYGHQLERGASPGPHTPTSSDPIEPSRRASFGHMPVDATAAGIAPLIKEGPITDADFPTPFDGLMGIDTRNGRLYFRSGGRWHFIQSDG